MLDKLDKAVQKLRPFVPFTPPNLAWVKMDKRANSILDVGCGEGEPAKFMKRKFMKQDFFIVGIDIHRPYLVQCKKRRALDECILCDARKLPFRIKSFDVVLCIEVLEHLSKKEGLKLVGDMEQIARIQTIISTPVGVYQQCPYDANPYQEHKSIWYPNELKGLGYNVKGLGFPNLMGRRITSYLPRIAKPVGHVIWVLVGPLVWFIPKLAGDMLCIKYVERRIAF